MGECTIFFSASVIRYPLLYRWIIQTWKKKWHHSTTSITYNFQIVDGCRSILSLQVVVDFRFFNGNLPFCVIKIVSNLGECCWGKNYSCTTTHFATNILFCTVTRHVFSEYKMDLCNQQHKGIISPNNDNFVP